MSAERARGKTLLPAGTSTRMPFSSLTAIPASGVPLTRSAVTKPSFASGTHTQLPSSRILRSLPHSAGGRSQETSPVPSLWYHGAPSSVFFCSHLSGAPARRSSDWPLKGTAGPAGCAAGFVGAGAEDFCPGRGGGGGLEPPAAAAFKRAISSGSAVSGSHSGIVLFQT